MYREHKHMSRAHMTVTLPYATLRWRKAGVRDCAQGKLIPALLSRSAVAYTLLWRVSS